MLNLMPNRKQILTHINKRKSPATVNNYYYEMPPRVPEKGVRVINNYAGLPKRPDLLDEMKTKVFQKALDEELKKTPKRNSR
jgi:hypothetical protein